jgi:hypothetical protein
VVNADDPFSLAACHEMGWVSSASASGKFASRLIYRASSAAHLLRFLRL